MNGFRIGLRHIDKRAHLPGLGDAKQHSVAFVYQRSGIDVTQRNDSGKRRPDGLIAFQFPQARQVGLGCRHIAIGRSNCFLQRLHVSLLGCPLRLVNVIFLSRYCTTRHQVLPSFGGNARQVLIAAALIQRGLGLLDRASGLLRSGLGLQNLLIELRGFNLR